MKKLILAVTLVFLLLSCGPTEKEKYDALFDDDNPLIGTWEVPGQYIEAYTGKILPNPQLVFIDDSTVHFIDCDGKVDVYNYEFDRTPIYDIDVFDSGSIEHHIDVAMRVIIYGDTYESWYDNNKKILYRWGDPCLKIKK